MFGKSNHTIMVKIASGFGAAILTFGLVVVMVSSAEPTLAAPPGGGELIWVA